MRYFLLTLFSILIFLPAFGQVIDDSELKKLESGQFKLEPGMIQVTFLDTVTADYMESKLSELGYEVISSDFENILLSVINDPKPEQLKEIEENEFVEFIMSETSNVSDEELEGISKSDSLDDNKVNQMLAQLNHSRKYDFIFVALNDEAIIDDAYQIINSYPELDIRIIKENQRTAIIKTEYKKEAETMSALNKLGFVKSTELLGIID